MKKAAFTLTFALGVGVFIAWTAISTRGQSSSTQPADEPSYRSSGITTKTNQYGAETNEFGASTNQWGNTNLPPTSTNKWPRIYGTNAPSESSNAAPSDVPK